MTDKLNAFYEKISSDDALKEELFELLKDVKLEDQITVTINFAKGKGFELSEEDFEIDDEDVNLDELETVAGGGGCGCVAAGGGRGDGLKCGCAIIGKGTVNDHPKADSQGGCYCVGAGAGATRRH